MRTVRGCSDFNKKEWEGSVILTRDNDFWKLEPKNEKKKTWGVNMKMRSANNSRKSWFTRSETQTFEKKEGHLSIIMWKNNWKFRDKRKYLQDTQLAIGWALQNHQECHIYNVWTELYSCQHLRNHVMICLLFFRFKK